MNDDRQLLKEAFARLYAECREHLHPFFHLMFRVLAPGTKFNLARHFRVLATALEKAGRGEITRLLICIPPRHGKSLLGSVALPAWLLGRNPGTKIICASYGEKLSHEFSHRCREVMLSPDYRRLFPNTTLQSSALDQLRTTANGYRLATSVGGVVTGMGADFVILDDPSKAADSYSEAARNAVYDWVKTGVMSRFDNPAKGVLIVIMQRLHQDDLIARLRDEGGFELLEMPGEAVVSQTFDLGGGETWHYEPGDLLYPEMFNREALDQMRLDLGEIGYSAQVLQRPSPAGGALFKLKHIQRYDTVPRLERIVQSWDTATTDGNNSSYCVCTTWGIWEKKLYLLDVFRKRLKFTNVPPAILSLRDKYKANAVILETSGVGKAVGDVLTQGDPLWQGWLVGYEPKEDKLSRAVPTTLFFEKKLVYLPKQADWLETYEAELGEFPLSKYDQVDSTTQFLYVLGRSCVVTWDLSSYPPSKLW